MGTCPKCKLRIRKNGNHIKLGSTWYHKSCPRNGGAKKPDVTDRRAPARF